ncbi:MAG: glycosyltransferase family 9 protein [Syntrophobacteraceae bacterium]
MSGKKAVVFHQGALGDFLLAAAAIDELAAIGGFTRVDFWSKPEHVSLLAEKSYLGRCLPCESPLVSALLHDTLRRTARLPDFLVEAESIFIFGQSGSRVMAGRLKELLSTDVNWIQSFPLAEEARREHVSDFLRRQFTALSQPIAGRPLALLPPEAEKRGAEELLRQLGIHSKPIILHPGSGGRRKVWPLAKWWGLIDRIRRENSSPVLLSVGPADEYLLEFSTRVRESGIPVVNGLSVLNLSALLSLCSLYIGSDSGVSHLAAAMGIPTLALFGPTDSRVWAPRGRHAIALQRQWKEEEVMEWSPVQRPDFEDDHIMSIINGKD